MSGHQRFSPFLALQGFTLGLLLFFSSPAALAFNATPSQPERAVFYPDEVEVTVSESVTPMDLPSGGKGLLIPLPPGVRHDSFLIRAEGSAGAAHFWLEAEDRDRLLAGSGLPPVSGGRATLPENEPSPERKALLQQLIPLQEEAAGKEGALAAVQARITLWEKSLERYAEDAPADSPLSPAEEAAKLNEAYAKHIPGLYLERDRQRRSLEDVRLRRDRAVKALKDFDHRENYAVVAVPLDSSNSGGTPVAVRYSYVMPGSCALSYRIGAWPDKDAISVAQDATLTQHSGFAWTGVDVYVSTLRRDRALQPQNIAPWLISMRDSSPPLSPAARKSVSSPAPMSGQIQAAYADMAAEPEAVYAPPPAPSYQERGTFRLWSLSKRRIEDKSPVTLALADDDYKASFLYTVRPLSNPKGFLTADLTLAEALELPPGMAQFSVDGAPVGSRHFSFNGDKGTIFFGTDPQVTATMRDLGRRGGEQGIFSKDQVLSWQWQITLKNTRSKPVEILLEDPAPLAEDTAITVKTDSSPKPETVVNAPEHGGATIYRWKATLGPGEQRVVQHKVEVSAPADKKWVLDPGIRAR